MEIKKKILVQVDDIENLENIVLNTMKKQAIL